MLQTFGLYTKKKMQERTPFSVDRVLTTTSTTAGSAATLATITIPNEAFSVMGALGYVLIHSIWSCIGDGSPTNVVFSIEIGAVEVFTKTQTPATSGTTVYRPAPVIFWNQGTPGSQKTYPASLIGVDASVDATMTARTIDTGNAVAVVFKGNSAEATVQTASLEFADVQVWPM